MRLAVPPLENYTLPERAPHRWSAVSRVNAREIRREKSENQGLPFSAQCGKITFAWGCSTVGQSASFTSKRSGVRAPPSPPKREPPFRRFFFWSVVLRCSRLRMKNAAAQRSRQSSSAAGGLRRANVRYAQTISAAFIRPLSFYSLSSTKRSTPAGTSARPPAHRTTKRRLRQIHD